MDDQISRIIKKHYPEIAQGWHVPVWAIVTSINENSNPGDVSDPFRPKYAVSLKLLDKNGSEAKAPEMENITLSGSFSASGGIMQLPEPGSIVELDFAYGQLNKPYVRTVLPYGSTLPGCKPGEVAIQARKGASIQIDETGSINKETDRVIKQISAQLEQLTGHHNVKSTSKQSNITSHYIENVGGKYQLSALGALMLLTTGHAELSALESLNFTTASDLNENVAGKRQAVIKELLSFKVDKNEFKLDKNGLILNLKSGPVNIGNDSANITDILYQLLDLVNQMATALSTHTHPTSMGPAGPSIDAGPSLAGQATQANALATQLKPLVP